VLVTGGAGFIGTHVARRLLAEGHTVRILDNLDPFYDVDVKRRNVERLSADAGSRLSVTIGDIRDAATVATASRDVDAVLHLAALAGVRPSIADPVRYMDVNVTGTQVVLQALRDRPQVRFVFAGSSSVYGGNPKVPFHEDDPVDHPVSPYAASKKAGEVLCHCFHWLHGNPTTVLRFFTVYGPGQRPEMAIHMFCRRILAGDPLPFFGDGSSRRDYTYVDDIVDGVVRALERADGYRIYNLGGAATTSLAELVAALEAATGRTAILDRKPDQAGDVRATFADVSRARAELGYAAKVDLAEGLRRFVEWYRAERAEGRVA
jgi:UDP-glucuronate 4-epimerase